MEGDGGPARRSGPQSRAWRQLFRKQFHKTKMCRFYPLGECRYGQDCPYAHDPAEIEGTPDLTKTALCADFQNGCCKKEAARCPFAHGPGELRTTNAFSASPLCKRANKESGEAPQQAPLQAERKDKHIQQLQQQHQQQQRHLEEQQRQLESQLKCLQAQMGGALLPLRQPPLQGLGQPPQQQSPQTPQMSPPWDGRQAQQLQQVQQLQLQQLQQLQQVAAGNGTSSTPGAGRDSNGGVIPPAPLEGKSAGKGMHQQRTSPAPPQAPPMQPQQQQPPRIQMVLPVGSVSPQQAQQIKEAAAQATDSRGRPRRHRGRGDRSGRGPEDGAGRSAIVVNLSDAIVAPAAEAAGVCAGSSQPFPVSSLPFSPEAGSRGLPARLAPRQQPAPAGYPSAVAPSGPTSEPPQQAPRYPPTGLQSTAPALPQDAYTGYSPKGRSKEYEKSRMSTVSDSPTCATMTPASTVVSRVQTDRTPAASNSREHSPQWMAEPVYVCTSAGPRTPSPGGHYGGSRGSSPTANQCTSPARFWPRTPSSCASPGRHSPAARWPHTPSSSVAVSPNASPSPRRKARGGLTPAALNLHLKDIFGTAHGRAGEGFAAAAGRFEPLEAAVGARSGTAPEETAPDGPGSAGGRGRPQEAMRSWPENPAKQPLGASPSC